MPEEYYRKTWYYRFADDSGISVDVCVLVNHSLGIILSDLSLKNQKEMLYYIHVLLWFHKLNSKKIMDKEQSILDF